MRTHTVEGRAVVEFIRHLPVDGDHRRTLLDDEWCIQQIRNIAPVGFLRGLLIAVPISLALWGFVIAGVWLIGRWL